jgi:hypothetical protein
MADFLYTKAKEGFLSGGLAWSGSIKAVLVDTGNYTPNAATHQYLSDIPVGARVATSGALANLTTADGVADADDVTLSSVTGATVEAIVLYKDTGDPATSPLIAYLDSYGGLVLTPSGSNVLITWPSTANKIFKL